jgi:hypothetical protein
MNTNSKLSLLMTSLTEFYQNKDYINEIKNIVDQNNVISLRILDWFITNYSKKNQVIINENFNVYQNYKLMLKSFSKSSFDPFCRKNKIVFYYNDTEYIETSSGQLCFFRWCFENKIIDYVRKNLSIIEQDMKTSLKQKQNENRESASDIKRRQPLSISASRTINKQEVKYIVNFD